MNKWNRGPKQHIFEHRFVTNAGMRLRSLGPNFCRDSFMVRCDRIGPKELRAFGAGHPENGLKRSKLYKRAPHSNPVLFNA